MTGYTKLFGSIVASTIWREAKETKIVWITMLAMAGKTGIVEASIPGLADFARVSLEECEKALKVLSSPDPFSRTKDHEGRRIKAIDGGWLLLNHAKYRAKMSAEDKAAYQRAYMAKYRADGKDKTRLVKPLVRSVSSGKEKLARLGQAEAEAEAEADPGLPAREVELPPSFPKTEAEARGHAAFVGCPDEFATKMWNKACSRGGRDAKDVPLRNFRAYLAIEWAYERERQAKNGSTPNHQETNEERNARMLREAL